MSNIGLEKITDIHNISKTKNKTLSYGLVTKNGKYIITCSVDNMLIIYDSETYDFLYSKDESDNNFTSITEIENDKIVTTGDITKVYHLENAGLKCLKKLDPDHFGPSLFAKDLENGCFATIGIGDLNVNIYKSDNLLLSKKLKIEGSGDSLIFIHKYQNILLVSNEDDGIFIYDLNQKYKLIKQIKEIIEAIVDYKNYILIGNTDTIKFLDMNTLSITRKIKGEYDKISSLINLNDKDILVGDWDGDLIITNVNTNKEKFRKDKVMTQIYWMCKLGNDEIVVGGTYDKQDNKASHLQVYQIV